MEEQKQNEEVKKEEVDILEVAKKRSEELNKANQELEDQIRKHDRLIAEQIVKGRSFGGTPQVTEKDKINEEAEVFANALGRTFKK
ncbi:hypothetical protein M0R04_15590 [Candidatus Dojkabacteria bacterium]|jgi:hypothetical protein|nr:hypothetical protein [Candidatus Dojkabacteria bacterium]